MSEMNMEENSQEIEMKMELGEKREKTQGKIEAEAFRIYVILL